MLAFATSLHAVSCSRGGPTGHLYWSSALKWRGVLQENPLTTPNAPRPRRQFLVVAVSLVVGLALPIILALGPAAGGGESRMTGAVLLGWAIGWALIAALSTRFTDQPLWWAFVPAGAL